MVVLRAQLQDRAAEEPELHTDLDQHREVTEAQRLEGRDGGADVTAAAVLRGEAEPRGARGGHLPDQLEHALAELLARQLDGLVEHGGVAGELLADHLANLAVVAVEQSGQGRDVDGGRRVLGLIGHGATMP